MTVSDARAIPGDNTATIRVAGLTKTFGRSAILRGIDLQVRRGETLVLYGPNGAGKTTLLRILATLSKPTSGQVTIEGLDPRQQANQIRQRVGVVLHHTFLYDDLTVAENLSFYGRMFGVERLAERIDTVLRLVGLEQRRHSTVRTLSRGMQQRATIARAVLHDPPIVLLDEPDTGLDQEGFAMLHRTLRGTADQPRTVLMTTHNLERGLAVSQRVAIISAGRITYEAASDEIETGAFAELYSRYTRVTR